MMRQWEVVSKEEEKITLEGTGTSSISTVNKRKERTKGKKTRKVVGWSTKKMEEKEIKQDFLRHGRNGAMEERRSRRN